MEMPVIIENQLVNMKWGLIPSWSQNKSFANKLINARCETLLEKPSFKNLVNTQRCIVPSNGFYEWDPVSKLPYFIKPADSSLMNFCGLHTLWMDENRRPVNTFTIITTKSNQIMSEIHNRMPVILEQGSEHKWLDRANSFAEVQNLVKPISDSSISISRIEKVI
jgi:putative SOS response-associated peptidase YedK